MLKYSFCKIRTKFRGVETDTNGNKIKVYFMGAGAFAPPVLRAICACSEIELVGTATQPDKAAGRKRILTSTPLGQWADANGIPCDRVVSVNTEEFLEELRKLAPDLVVVVSFGQILKQPILDAPRCGCLNVHASILPRYRGASPIASAILNGDEETGVTFMQMERGLDSGPMYAIDRMPIPAGITTEALEKQLAEMAGKRIAEVIRDIVRSNRQPVPQPENGVTIATKIRKVDGSVDWTEDAAVIERRIRAYAKWPNTRFCFSGKDRPVQVRITSATATAWSPAGEPGKILSMPNGKRQLMVKCGSGALLIERVLPEGKKEMAVADFINGAHLNVGDMLLNGPDKLPAATE